MGSGLAVTVGGLIALDFEPHDVGNISCILFTHILGGQRRVFTCPLHYAIVLFFDAFFGKRVHRLESVPYQLIIDKLHHAPVMLGGIFGIFDGFAFFSVKWKDDNSGGRLGQDLRADSACQY